MPSFDYIELKQVALVAENYEDTLKYCNSILEIDPKNVDAWIDKAIAAFSIRPPENRYTEVKEYLKRVAELAPDNSRIADLQENLRTKQATWLNEKGLEHYQSGINIYNSLHHADGIFDIARAERVCREKSEPQFVSAMNAFIAATSFEPEDLAILNNIAQLAEKISWINWSPQVNELVKKYKSL
jgi:tetratricopeptide (TPR) repeat protein